jgi:N-acetylglucosamine kinase-like BadF-type ATPase
MILVTDIGSTKADWILMDESGILIRFDTIGFNPFFVDSSDIVNELQSKSELTELRNKSLELFFYGAGSSSSERKEIVLNAMKSLLPEALIKVEHDLLGAARATAGDEPGVICILGTGSNACFFDGNKIEGGLPSLGFILGDEGSGSYFGKRILTDCAHAVAHDVREILYGSTSGRRRHHEWHAHDVCLPS